MLSFGKARLVFQHHNQRIYFLHVDSLLYTPKGGQNLKLNNNK